MLTSTKTPRRIYHKSKSLFALSCYSSHSPHPGGRGQNPLGSAGPIARSMLIPLRPPRPSSPSLGSIRSLHRLAANRLQPGSLLFNSSGLEEWLVQLDWHSEKLLDPLRPSHPLIPNANRAEPTSPHPATDRSRRRTVARSFLDVSGRRPRPKSFAVGVCVFHDFIQVGCATRTYVT